ncbi:MAG: YdeI/OmpD-associated family protein [Cyclobacteriaceae bacterium]|nr:YdeI/OmpD-associated family protein [Cyclobacteriaceae bacterium]
MKTQENASGISKELQFLITKSNIFTKKFESLSLSQQQEYSNYIEEAILEELKRKRLEKIIPMILEGKGLKDK